MKSAAWMPIVIFLLAVLPACQSPPETQEPAPTVKAAVTPVELAEHAFGTAQAHRAAGRLEAAEADYRRALKALPEKGDAWFGLARVLEQRGRAADAEIADRKAFLHGCRDVALVYGIALGEHKKRNTRSAIELYETIIAEDADHFGANLNLATAYLQIGKPIDALPYADVAAELNPASQAALVNQGVVLAALGEHGGAVDSYQKAWDIGPVTPPLMLNMGESLIHTGNYRRAADTLEAVSKVAATARVFERLGYACIKMGDAPRGAAAYRRALQLDKSSTASLNGLGVALMSQYHNGGSKQDALRHRAIASWRASLALRPDQPRMVALVQHYSGN